MATMVPPNPLRSQDGAGPRRAFDAEVDPDAVSGTSAGGTNRWSGGGSGRLVGIDIARAVALVGMFTQHTAIYDELGNGSSGWVGWVFTEAAGRAAVLFFVLSGISLSLIHRRGSASATDSALYRRGFLLLTGGLLLTLTIWPASILQHYGVAFLLAPLLVRIDRAKLAAVGAAGLVGGPVALLFMRNLGDSVVGAWDGPSGQWLLSTVWELLFSGIYPMVLWIGFFALGMLLGRLDLSNRRTLLRLLAVSLVAATSFGLVATELRERHGQPDQAAFDSNEEAGPGEKLSDDEKFFGDDGLDGESFDEEFFDGAIFAPTDVPVDWRDIYSVAGHSGGMGWTLQTSALAAAMVALALLLPAAATAVVRPLAWTGSMSLTAYLVHIVLVTDVFTNFVEEADVAVVIKEWAVLGLILTMIAVCSAFRLLLGAGPLERLLKLFTVPGSRAQASRP